MAKNRHTPSEGDYAIGYGRPPKTSQWKKGVSGNPSGRKKGSLNSKTVLEEVFSRPVMVTEGGQPVEVDAAKALLMFMLSAALKGNMRAATFMTELFVRAFDGDEEPLRELTDDDAAILDRFVGRRTRVIEHEPTDQRSGAVDNDEAGADDGPDGDGGASYFGHDGGGDGRP